MRKKEVVLDQYYTDPTYANYFYKKISEVVDLSVYDILLEPSAGEGSFYNLLPTSQRFGLDIDPKVDGIIKENFYDYYPDIPVPKIFTLGNPPFGNQSKDAINFFNHAANFSLGIGFVLPMSFCKMKLQSKLNPYFHLVFEEIVPKNSFYTLNGKKDVKTVAQIWIKKTNKRIEENRNLIDYFQFVSYYDDYDLILRRIGYNSGRFENNVLESEKNQFLYIKTNSEEIKQVICKIDFSYIRNLTGGGYAINQDDVKRLFLIQNKNVKPVFQNSLFEFWLTLDPTE